MAEKYSERVVDAYRRSRSKLPIATWVKVIGSKLPEFRGNNSIYAPVTLFVKIAGGISESTGNVKIKVASTDQNWYSTLKQAIGDMVKRNPAAIEIVDYVGDRIDQRKPESLHHVGELDVIDAKTKQPIRLAKAVAPPAYLSTNKLAVLRDWSETIREPLTQLVASTLAGRSMPEIGQLTLKDGPLHRSIVKLISDSTAPDFLDTYSVDDVSRATSPAQKTETMARSVLFHVRGALAANKTRIEEFHAHEQGRKLGDQPIFVSSPVHENDLVMYQEIAGDAISSEILGKKLVHTIYNGNRSATKAAPPRVSVQARAPAGRHPRDQYYDEYHFPKFGKYPGHAMDRFNKTRVEGSASTQYRGNPATVASMFKLFTGQFLTPIECNTCGGKNKKKKKNALTPVESMLPPLIPIAGKTKDLIACGTDEDVNSVLPPLVPIAGHMKGKGKGKDKKKKLYAVESMLPPLIPIAGKTKDLIACGTDQDDDGEDKDVNSMLPPLVPIAGHMKGKGKGKDKKKKHALTAVSAQLPPLVPIAGHMKHKAKKDEDEDDVIQRAIDNERIDDNLFSAPTFTSFLQKKYSSK
jgi:hypothetical protein